MGSTLKGKNLLQWEQILFYNEMTPIYMGGNSINDKVASPESVPIHFKYVYGTRKEKASSN